MSTSTITVYHDDLTGEEIPAGSVRVTQFSLGNQQYELDLSEYSYGQFQEAIAPYIRNAHPVARAAARGRKAGASNGPATKKVRAWALSQGIPVSDRGRIPQHIIDAYLAAN
ncbi:MAG: Lsr2 family protein [Propionibacteriaceae bacterium]|nr:Lsr2 family protein [Propionibacteriaceae bacterium]